MAPWLVHTAVASPGPEVQGDQGGRHRGLSLETERLLGAQPCSTHLGPQGAEVGVVSWVWSLATLSVEGEPSLHPSWSRGGSLFLMYGILKRRPGTPMPAPLLCAVTRASLRLCEPPRPLCQHAPWCLESWPQKHLPGDWVTFPQTAISHCSPITVSSQTWVHFLFTHGPQLGLLQPWTMALLQDRQPPLPARSPGKATLCQKHTKVFPPQALCRPGLT